MGIKEKNMFNKIKRNTPYFEDFITRSIYNSNAIEGNTLSFAETYALVFKDNSLKVNATAREIYEAINLKYAFNHVLQNLDSSISIDMIKTVGKLINKNISEIDGFRTASVFIRGAEHIPPDASQVPRLISELIYESEQKSEDIFLYCARFHIQFERIHPFIDGNGRTGRLLITKQLLSNGYAPVVIPLDDRLQYLKYLADCDTLGLANMLRNLNKKEIERMEKFGINMN
ncbi:MAG: Fic family protein [Anaerocolumna sp.]